MLIKINSFFYILVDVACMIQNIYSHATINNSYLITLMFFQWAIIIATISIMVYSIKKDKP